MSRSYWAVLVSLASSPTKCAGSLTPPSPRYAVCCQDVVEMTLSLDVYLQIKGTYLVIYGKWPTFAFTVFTVLVGVASSFWMGLSWLLWPLEALMLLVSVHPLWMCGGVM